MKVVGRVRVGEDTFDTRIVRIGECVEIVDGEERVGYLCKVGQGKVKIVKELPKDAAGWG